MSKVYILENDKGISKLGFTGVSAESRRAMCSSTMCSDFSVIAYFDDPATPARQLERMGHNLLSDYRIATKDCHGNNCFEYYKMPTETMALLMAYLMEGTRDHLEFHEFGRQQPRAKLLHKLLFGIKRAKRAITNPRLAPNTITATSARSTKGRAIHTSTNRMINSSTMPPR